VLEGDDQQNTIAGTIGDDVVSAKGNNDSIDLSAGGNDILYAGGGNDTIAMGASLTAADRIDGGSQYDRIQLSGDYSAGLVFAAATMINVEEVRLAAGNSYRLITHDNTVAAGQVLTVDGSNLDAGHGLVFDGSAEKDGAFVLTGGAGADDLDGGMQNDTISGGGGNDRIALVAGGDDTAAGGAGDDSIAMGAALTSADRINGGADKDLVTLNGDYSAGVVFVGGTMVNVERINLRQGFDYNITIDDTTVAAGKKLNVDGTALGAANHLIFDGSAEMDGRLDLRGGAGGDSLIGGHRGDTFSGGLGADTFVYLHLSDSLSGNKARDTITDFSQAQSDRIDLSAIDADTVSDGDQAFHLGGSVFTHVAGELIYVLTPHGNTLLKADVNGDGKVDFSIELTGAVHLSETDFVL
jgi:Ca2+-binding RTX toxin-like protein